jgi:hypothetical protein
MWGLHPVPLAIPMTSWGAVQSGLGTPGHQSHRGLVCFCENDNNRIVCGGPVCAGRTSLPTVKATVKGLCFAHHHPEPP